MTTPPKPSPEAVAAACEIDTKCAHVGYFGDACIHLDRAERIIDRHFAPIIAKAELCDRLAAALDWALSWAEEGIQAQESDGVNMGKVRGFYTKWNSVLTEYRAAVATRAAGPAVVGGGRD